MPRKGWYKKAKKKFEADTNRRAMYNAKSRNRKMRKDLNQY